MYNTNLSKRQENPNYTPWLVAGGLALAGYGAWYYFFREDEEEKEDGDEGTGVVPSNAWGSGDTYSVKVERDYTTFVPSNYPEASQWSVEADPSAVQINKSERVPGGFQIDFTPLQTGLHNITIATEAGFGNPLLQLNVRSVL